MVYGMLHDSSQVKQHCEENIAWLESSNILCTVHTSCHPTLQHHNSYNRTENRRQWNVVRPPDDGHKDARNMLRYNWLPINHHLLHPVGLAFVYCLFCCLPYDRSTASSQATAAAHSVISNTSSFNPHYPVIYLGHTVAAYVFFFIFPSLLKFPLSFFQ